MYDIMQPAMVAVELQNVPVLFIANKQDVDGAMSADDIIHKLDLLKFMQNRTWCELMDMKYHFTDVF